MLLSRVWFSSLFCQVQGIENMFHVSNKVTNLYKFRMKGFCKGLNSETDMTL